MGFAPLLPFSPSQKVMLYDDWIGTTIGNIGWNTSNTGTGSALTGLAATDAIHHGILILNTGTTTTGRGSVFLSNAVGTGTMRVTGGTIHMEWDVQVPTLSTSTDRFQFRCGFGDSITTDFSNGVYFEYDDSLSANWRIKTANAATRTTTDSGVVVAAGSWYKLAFDISVSGTSALFSINGTSVGTIATNLPTLDVTPTAFLLKSVGTTNRSVYIDYFFMTAALGSAR